MLTRAKDAARFAAQAGFVSSWRAMAWYAAEQRYERHLGIQSASFIDAARIKVSGIENEAYEVTGYQTLKSIFERIKPSEGDATDVLLDAGCGTGRVMAFAATLNYREVIGFDISPSLVEIAARNLEQAAPRFRCKDVTVSAASAADFEIPDTVTTVFCFNPFYGSVMTRFVDRVRASALRLPRPIRLVFVNPKLCKVDLKGFEMTQSFSCFDPRMGAAHDYHQRVEVFASTQRVF
jgi:predicted RNA methylase